MILYSTSTVFTERASLSHFIQSSQITLLGVSKKITKYTHLGRAIAGDNSQHSKTTRVSHVAATTLDRDLTKRYNRTRAIPKCQNADT